MCVLRLMQRDGTLWLHYFLHGLYLRDLNRSSAWPLSAVHPPLRGRREWEGGGEGGLIVSLFIHTCVFDYQSAWWMMGDKKAPHGNPPSAGPVSLELTHRDIGTPAHPQPHARCLQDAFRTRSFSSRVKQNSRSFPGLGDLISFASS